MTPTTLRALRQFLFFSVDEAAELIGKVSPRSWQYWEAGSRSIPEDVKHTIEQLCSWREDALRQAESTLRDRAEDAEIVLLWYGSLDAWLTLPDRVPLLWRPQCSVIAELCAKVDAVAVLFDAPSYARWLDGRADSETMRNEWVASQ